MAKTHDNGNWPREFEVSDGESSPDQNRASRIMGAANSYQTLNAEQTQYERNHSVVLDKIEEPSVESVEKRSMMKKSEIPEQFRDATLTGFKTKISPKSTLPSCVNEAQRAKHSKFEPTVDSMLELIEEQVFDLNKDE